MRTGFRRRFREADAHEIACRRIAPVEILERDHQRPLACEARDQGQEELEQAALPAGGRNRTGGCPGRGSPPSWHLEERRELRNEAHELRADVADDGAELYRPDFVAEAAEGLGTGRRQAVPAEVDAPPISTRRRPRATDGRRPG